MAKPSKKSTPKEKKSRGRQSDFSGEKEAYLDGLAKKFANCKDRSAFYGEAAQGLIDQFGYSRDGRVYVDGNTLSTEEKLEYYKNLRSVSDHGPIVMVLQYSLLARSPETWAMVPSSLLSENIGPHLRF